MPVFSLWPRISRYCSTSSCLVAGVDAVHGNTKDHRLPGAAALFLQAANQEEPGSALHNGVPATAASADVPVHSTPVDQLATTAAEKATIGMFQCFIWPLNSGNTVSLLRCGSSGILSCVCLPCLYSTQLHKPQAAASAACVKGI